MTEPKIAPHSKNLLRGPLLLIHDWVLKCIYKIFWNIPEAYDTTILVALHHNYVTQ